MAAIEPRYFFGNGKYQRELNQFSEVLVPSSGKCETIEGEILRAITNINWDCSNNGFCNNTTGALNFLVEKLRTINCKFDGVIGLIEDIRPCVNHKRFYASDIEIEKAIPAIDDLLDIIVELIIAKNGEYQFNDEDLWDYQDKDKDDDDDDDE